jgi:tRNA(Ile)-lysidine synthase
MALAFLYSRARAANSSLPYAHGFIVDHKVRPESTEEAKWVAEQLRSKCELHEHSMSFLHTENNSRNEELHLNSELVPRP